ncbi:MAG: hypothetical protein Q8Q12_16380 [bacterium]|nr:hypothetical protein [bacterium]
MTIVQSLSGSRFEKQVWKKTARGDYSGSKSEPVGEEVETERPHRKHRPRPTTNSIGTSLPPNSFATP